MLIGSAELRGLFFLSFSMGCGRYSSSSGDTHLSVLLFIDLLIIYLFIDMGDESGCGWGICTHDVIKVIDN